MFAKNQYLEQLHLKERFQMFYWQLIGVIIRAIIYLVLLGVEMQGLLKTCALAIRLRYREEYKVENTKKRFQMKK